MEYGVAITCRSEVRLWAVDTGVILVPELRGGTGTIALPETTHISLLESEPISPRPVQTSLRGCVHNRAILSVLAPTLDGDGATVDEFYRTPKVQSSTLQEGIPSLSQGTGIHDPGPLATLLVAFWAGT